MAKRGDHERQRKAEAARLEAADRAYCLEQMRDRGRLDRVIAAMGTDDGEVFEIVAMCTDLYNKGARCADVDGNLTVAAPSFEEAVERSLKTFMSANRAPRTQHSAR